MNNNKPPRYILAKPNRQYSPSLAASDPNAPIYKRSKFAYYMGPDKSLPRHVAGYGMHGVTCDINQATPLTHAELIALGPLRSLYPIEKVYRV